MNNKMKTKNLLGLLLIMTLIFSGCEKETTVPPLAKFKIKFG